MKFIKKTKTRTFILAILTIAIFGLGSCEKETRLNNEKNQNISELNGDKGNTPYIYNGVEYYYFLDSEELTIENFEPNDTTDSFICISGDSDGDSNLVKIYIHEFTTEQKYVAFGGDNELKLKESLLFEDEMRDYIEENNIEEIFNSTGEIPQDYLDYEEERYNYYFGTNEKVIPGTTLHKNYWGGSPAYHMFKTMPVMFGWNNEVSATFPTYFFGFHILYNRNWYRARMITIWGFGWDYYRFVGPLGFLSDKMSSGFST